MPKVSVIMAVFNTEKFLPDAIESILYQDFSDFECIILDDASTDNSYKILQKYAEKDARIKIFKNPKNMWISYTRNRLIELTNTDFIAIQDSDDVSFWNRLSLQYHFLKKNPDFAVVSGDNIIIDEDGNVIGKRKYSDNISKIILKKSPISQPSSMFRKKIFQKIGGYDENLDYAEDYDVWMKMYISGYKIKNLNENLVYYRIRRGQTKTEKLKKTLQNTIFIQKNAIKNGLKPSFSDRFYIFLEQILLSFPDAMILKIFTFLHYKNEK